MNMMKMMKQAATLQKQMKKIQEDLAERTVDFTSGGGMVIATARGDLTIERITIKPEVVDPDDVEMLEDLVRVAVDGALTAARELAAAEMGKLTGGMGLPPGMNLPF